MALYNTVEYWEGRKVTVVIWEQTFTRRKYERKLFDVESLPDKNFSWRAKVKVNNKVIEVKYGRTQRESPLDAPDGWTSM